MHLLIELAKTNMVDIILSIPKTIWYNFMLLPFWLAIKLPIWVHYNASIKCRGKIVLSPLSPVHFAMVRIGFHVVPGKSSNEKTSIYIGRDGNLEFEGTAHIGRGSRIYVSRNGKLTLGNNFAISASSSILCYKRVLFGKDIQFSWDCLVMDSDTHDIIGESGEIRNEAREIVFGDKVWIGCRTTILKGSYIPSHCVIGAGSLVSGKHFEPHTIIAGVPAKSVKRIKEWKL